MRGAEKRKKRLFGTNGVRGVVGQGMTPELVMHIGMALASMRPGTIAVGRDTRTSGPAFASAIKAGILSCGSNAVDLGVLPTPALQYLVRHHFDAGAVITASHNPPEYNGVKVIEPDGTEMGDEETIALEEMLFEERFATVGWREVGVARDAPEMIAEYIDAVVGQFPPGIGKGIRVVVDPGSGPATVTTPAILNAMGCGVFTVNAQMDGTFPGRLPEPSPEGLSLLSRMVVETGAAFGVAHDGDADRAVFVDEKGRYVEENMEFALIQRHICRKRPGVVVTPVSTSRLAEKIARETGSRVVYTPVGSIYVARTMLDLAARGEDVVFGGEGNGGLIFPDHQHCRDGGMTAAAMVHLIAETGGTLSELVSTLPHMVMIREKISADDPEELLQMAEKRFSGEELDLVDGVRINRKDSWALLRPSGTEPFMRLVVEAETKEAAAAFCREIHRAIGRGD
ncbi:MAG: phosphoglucosamine mutase [Methanomicrobiaceae archaeon]|nr:phosphoglucosamine mutase [Methanomicrobiaceae archaeon]